MKRDARYPDSNFNQNVLQFISRNFPISIILLLLLNTEISFYIAF